MIGDAIIDKYNYVLPMGKSSKENMIACLEKNEETFAGGIFATCNIISNFCNDVEIITCLGSKKTEQKYAEQALKHEINKNFFFPRRLRNHNENKIYRHKYNAKAL